MATLDPEEVSALMEAIKDDAVPAPSATGSRAPTMVTPYDLTGSGRINRGQMPTLDAMNEQIASTLGTGLAGRTRLHLKVASSPATIFKLLDFNALLAPPTIVCVLSLGLGHGQALVILEPGLGEALLGAALGDRKARVDEPTGPRRDLTSVERMVLKRLLTILTDAMTRAWAPIIGFQPEVLRFETDPRLASIAPPNESAIVSSFEVTGAITGRMQIAIPFAAVEPSKKLLSAPARAGTGSDARFTKALAREVEDIEVELSAHLGKTSLPVSRLLALEVGDILILDTDEGSPVSICVEGRPKLMGFPRVNHGSNALVLEGPVPAVTH